MSVHVTQGTGYKEGVFGTGVTTVSANMYDQGLAPLPMTLTLVSSDASRKIEIRTHPSASWFQPTYDQSATDFIAVSILSAISDCRFTGVANDKWSIK
jgi:hypothetical protein